MGNTQNQLPENVTALPQAERRENLRIIEALLFASDAPLPEKAIQNHFEGQVDVAALLKELQSLYAGRGVHVVKVGQSWALRTAPDLNYLLIEYQTKQKKLSKAALETLSIIAYHQPVTRAEIEAIRGVSTSKGTLDVLMETGWVKMRGRRRAPGRPITYGTSETFLDQFGFERIQDLPGLKELKGAGLLNNNLPPDFDIPLPDDNEQLRDDELPLDEGEDADLFEDRLNGDDG